MGSKVGFFYEKSYFVEEYGEVNPISLDCAKELARLKKREPEKWDFTIRTVFNRVPKVVCNHCGIRPIDHETSSYWFVPAEYCDNGLCAKAR